MSVTFYADRARTRQGFAAACFGYGSDNSYRGPLCATVEEAAALHAVHHPTVETAAVVLLEQQAAVAAGDHKAELESMLERLYDCDFTGVCMPVYDTDADPQVNMSNANAYRVGELLGLRTSEHGDDTGMPDAACGSMEAERFIGCVLLALALVPQDAGVPVMVDRQPGRATFIDCGRPDGYLQQRLTELLAVGEFARHHGAPVVWG